MLDVFAVIRSVIGGVLPTRADFIKENLAGEMSRHRGRKRLRKKKALRVLANKWLARTLAMPISRRLNYAEIGRQILTAQPLLPSVGAAILGGDE